MFFTSFETWCNQWKFCASGKLSVVYTEAVWASDTEAVLSLALDECLDRDLDFSTFLASLKTVLTFAVTFFFGWTKSCYRTVTSTAWRANFSVLAGHLLSYHHQSLKARRYILEAHLTLGKPVRAVCQTLSSCGTPVISVCPATSESHGPACLLPQWPVQETLCVCPWCAMHQSPCSHSHFYCVTCDRFSVLLVRPHGNPYTNFKLD